MSKRITLNDICRCYAEGTIKGGGFGRSRLNLKAGPQTIETLLQKAVQDGLIAHGGNIYGGWLTEAGIDRLPIMPENMQDAYRKALKRRGAFLGAG